MKKINKLLISGLSISMIAASVVGIIGFSSYENTALENQQENLLNKQREEEYHSVPRVIETHGENNPTIDEYGNSTGGGTIDSPGWNTPTTLNVTALEKILPNFFIGDTHGIQTTDNISRFSTTYLNPSNGTISSFREGDQDPGYVTFRSKFSNQSSSENYSSYSNVHFQPTQDIFWSIAETGSDLFRDFSLLENSSQAKWEYNKPVVGHIEAAMIRDEIQFSVISQNDSNFSYISSFDDSNGDYVNLTSSKSEWLENIGTHYWDQGFNIIPKTVVIDSAIGFEKNTVNIKGQLPIVTTEKGGIDNIEVTIKDTITGIVTKIGDINTQAKQMGIDFNLNFTHDNINTLNPQQITLKPDNSSYAEVVRSIAPIDIFSEGFLTNYSVSANTTALNVENFINGVDTFRADEYQVIKVKDNIENIISTGNISDILDNKHFPLDLGLLDEEMSNIKIKYYNKEFDLVNYPDGLFLGETNTVDIDPIRTDKTGNIKLTDMYDGVNEEKKGQVNLFISGLSLFDSVKEVRVKATDLLNNEVIAFDPWMTNNLPSSLSKVYQLPVDEMSTYVFSVEFGYTPLDGGEFVSVQTFDTTTDDMTNLPEEDWTTWGTLYKTAIFKEEETKLVEDSVQYNKFSMNEVLSISGAFNIGNNKFGKYKGDETFSLVVKNETGEPQIIEPKLLGEENLLAPGEKTFNKNISIDPEDYGLEYNIEYDIGIIMTTYATSPNPVEHEVWTDKITFTQKMLMNPSISATEIEATSAVIKTNGFANGSGSQKASTYKLTVRNQQGKIVQELEKPVITEGEINISLIGLTENTNYSFGIEFFEEGETTPITLENEVIDSGSFKTKFIIIEESIININSLYNKESKILKVTWEHIVGRGEDGTTFIPDNFEIILKFNNKDIAIPVVSTENEKIIDLNKLIINGEITQGDIDNGFIVIVSPLQGESYQGKVDGIVKRAITIAGISLIVGLSLLVFSYINKSRRVSEV